MLKKVIKGLKGVIIYLYANILISLYYEKKYIKSSWFGYGKRGYHKWMAVGWQWVVDDYKGCKKLNVNRNVPWPVSPRCCVIMPWNIEFHPECINIFQSFGIYFQGINKIRIGEGSTIGPNVGLISANHNPEKIEQHLKSSGIDIGKYCWIGMNSVILPGVVLGDYTTVGAGSVVTKSFPEGNCVIAGNPAKKIRDFVNNST